MLQLPSPSLGPAWSPAPRRNSRAAASLIAFVVVACVGYLTYEDLIGSKPAPEAAAATKPPVRALSASEQEDLLKHLEDAEGHAVKAAEASLRAQDWISRALPGLSQNYRAAEQR